MRDSKIAWTHHTFNPWWGCVKVSAGCTNCYAESFSRRMGKHVWGREAPRRFFGDDHWREPERWNGAAEAAGERHRVFCASMADVFEDREDLLLPRLRLFELIERTPHLDWLLLTKRPENVPLMAPWSWFRSFPPNVWMGTSVEDQEQARLRVPLLLRIPAPVRFLSMEPLLELVTLTHLDVAGSDPEWCQINALTGRQTDMGRPCRDVPRLSWIIVGGESGRAARRFDVQWARILRAECKQSDVALFMKQFGANVADWEIGSRIELNDPKGGDPSEWPVDLQVRELPKGLLE